MQSRGGQGGREHTTPRHHSVVGASDRRVWRAGRRILAACVVGLLALPCYLPALRAERVRDGQGRGGSAHSDTVGP